jgi:hypothetical protein
LEIFHESNKTITEKEKYLKLKSYSKELERQCSTQLIFQRRKNLLQNLPMGLEDNCISVIRKPFLLKGQSESILSFLGLGSLLKVFNFDGMS